MTLLSDKPPVKQKIIFFILSTIIAVALFVNFLYIPQRKQIARLASAAAKVQDDLNHVEGFMNKHSDIGIYEQKVQTKLNFIEKKLPDAIELSSFMEQVEIVASSSQVTITRMKPEKKFVKDHYTIIPLWVEFSGNYVQTLDFLKKLAQLDRFSSTSNMIIQSKNGILDCKLSLIIYSYGTYQDAKKQEISTATSNSYIE